ncbi:MAG: bifunctional pyr operon transcriptional regulator/uracil phosphoribosyltransferase PyrR [Deltaproteobacteria bacterium]|nr:bifunctional pyr operon transcriptional regulator/uracil phosphoribosyltransferase PyrR [Deltaproteobacteria bacterium]
MKTILDSKEMQMAIDKMAKEIVEESTVLDSLVLVGIRKRGVPLARRIAERIKEASKKEVAVGLLDINLYRDDLSRLDYHPVIGKTDIPCSVDEKTVFLVDDVLYTGRTIRCAMDALFDLGRPSAVKLAVLVDREGRELPVQGDVIGIHCPATAKENVKVSLKETDGKDEVNVE